MLHFIFEVVVMCISFQSFIMFHTIVSLLFMWFYLKSDFYDFNEAVVVNTTKDYRKV